jgi:hypothetical protein
MRSTLQMLCLHVSKRMSEKDNLQNARIARSTVATEGTILWEDLKADVGL